MTGRRTSPAEPSPAPAAAAPPPPVGSPPTTLAAIDVGTNSFHLVVARVLGNGGFDVLTQEKEMVRLGRGGGDMKELSTEAIDRGVAALARMRRIAAATGAPVRAVATSAVREAGNHDVFIRRARDEAGVEVEVISGVEEARLIHLGVLQALPVYDRRLFLCDIGGGSTELLLGRRGRVKASRSFKLGAVRLTDRFFPGGAGGDRDAVAACRGYVRSLVWPFQREVHTHGFDVFVASSGTAEAVAAMAQARTGRPAPKTFNGYVLDGDAVREVADQLVRARTPAQRAALAGLDPKRADIILAGALVLEGVVDAFGVDELTISGYALREGVLLDTLHRHEGGELHHLSDLARRSVQRLADQCDEEPAHSTHVARLAVRLFDETRRIHGLDRGCREYLEAGALLANVGLFVSHSQHHLHSYYLIRHSDRLVGLTDDEIEIIAQVARYHRKSGPKDRHPAFAALAPADQQVVRTLAGLLRVAIGLDRGHEAHVADLRARVVRRRLVVDVVPAAGADVALELYAANERRSLLEEVVGMPVDVRVAEPAG